MCSRSIVDMCLPLQHLPGNKSLGAQYARYQPLEMECVEYSIRMSFPNRTKSYLNCPSQNTMLVSFAICERLIAQKTRANPPESFDLFPSLISLWQSATCIFRAESIREMWWKFDRWHKSRVTSDIEGHKFSSNEHLSVAKMVKANDESALVKVTKHSWMAQTGD